MFLSYTPYIFNLLPHITYTCFIPPFIFLLLYFLKHTIETITHFQKNKNDHSNNRSINKLSFGGGTLNNHGIFFYSLFMIIKGKINEYIKKMTNGKVSKKKITKGRDDKYDICICKYIYLYICGEYKCVWRGM